MFVATTAILKTFLRLASPMEALDRSDRAILALLQADARMSNAEIARRVNLAPSAVYERIRKLENRGIILGYEARIDPKALGLNMTAFVFVRTDDRWGELDAAKSLAKAPEVQEIHAIAGEDCYLVKVRARDPEELRAILGERFSAIPSVKNTRTTIVLGTEKETNRLRLTSEEEEAHVRR